MASRSTFSSSFMFLVWMRTTSRRPISSGHTNVDLAVKAPKPSECWVNAAVHVHAESIGVTVYSKSNMGIWERGH